MKYVLRVCWDYSRSRKPAVSVRLVVDEAQYAQAALHNRVLMQTRFHLLTTRTRKAILRARNVHRRRSCALTSINDCPANCTDREGVGTIGTRATSSCCLAKWINVNLDSTAAHTREHRCRMRPGPLCALKRQEIKRRSCLSAPISTYSVYNAGKHLSSRRRAQSFSCFARTESNRLYFATRRRPRRQPRLIITFRSLLLAKNGPVSRSR